MHRSRTSNTHKSLNKTNYIFINVMKIEATTYSFSFFKYTKFVRGDVVCTRAGANQTARGTNPKCTLFIPHRKKIRTFFAGEFFFLIITLTDTFLCSITALSAPHANDNQKQNIKRRSKKKRLLTEQCANDNNKLINH